jgi:predicted hydrolase (HD superfamily)
MLQKTLGFLEKPWVFTGLYHDFTYHETEKPWKFTGYHEKKHGGSVL